MENNITSEQKQAKPVSAGNTSASSHCIVCVGASAGGLEAIHEFFDNVPESSNISFVVVQHLSPDYKSLLVELVSKHTHMNVFEASQDMTVQKNCVYVIPNNKLMTISGGKLQLGDKAPDKSPNTAIDIFLHSLAEDAGPNAIAVILSGTGTDGTKGIESIKRTGGMVLVQDPCTAKFDGMPNSAIASGNADMILAPELMPEEIYSHLQETPIHVLNKGKIDEATLEEIFRLVYKQSGHDFHFYKTPTIIRRISRRMSHKGIKKLDDYVAYLRENPEECKLLCKDFLIGVTKFFRDPAAFDILYNDVLPELMSKKGAGDTLKVWVAACSTGEEAYSLAIVIDKYLSAKQLSAEVKIFATDIDEAALELASKGMYPKSIEKDIEPAVLEKYFIKDGNHYHVAQHIRKQIVFARHNIIKDPPFIKNDIVTCRNMLIYMSAILQKKVMGTLSFSLTHGGFLLLGPSETANYMQGSLHEVNSKWKVYRRDGVGRQPVDSLYNRTPEFGKFSREIRTTPRQGIAKASRDINADFRELLAEEFGYAAFYIDSNYEVKEATGNYTRYVSLPEGSLNMNILKMLPTELSVALNSAIRKATAEGRKVQVKNVRLKSKSKNRNVCLIVRPGNKNVPDAPIMIVLWEGRRERGADKSQPHVPTSTDPDLNKYVMELESELKETRTELQMAIEGMETTNEELQSSNEELLSANEELQSSNEELQSVNEELHTLNTEHQLKIRELVELNDDLNNYFRTSDVAQIFLDHKLHIRKFNPAAVKMVNLIESDIGRPLAHISTNLRHDDLLDAVRGVMSSGHIVEKEIRLNDGRSTLMRILPYVRQDRQSDGAVITFVDISAIREKDDIIKGVFDSSPSAIMVFESVRDERNQIVDFNWVATNYAADMLLKRSGHEYVGKSLKKEFPAFFENEFFGKYVNVVKSDTPLRFEYNFKVGDVNLWFEIVAIKMRDGLVVTLTDVTEKKSADEKLKQNYGELMNVKENLRTLNHELESKVRERTKELSASEERFRLVTRATKEAIWDWDLGKNKVWWSDAYFNLFGDDGRDLHEHTIALKLDRVHPDERQRIQESLYSLINSPDRQWTAEYHFRKADGAYAKVLDRAYILHDEYGTPYRMLGSMLDITELRKAEAEVVSNIEQRKFLAEAMPLIVWTATPEGRLDFLNREFERYSGIRVADGLKWGWERIIYPDDRRILQEAWAVAMEQKQIFSSEVRLRRHDGAYRWYIVKGSPNMDEQGNVILWAGTFTDIHEQKAANEELEARVQERTKELQQMNQDLESSNIELQQFASVASHDLKEPLRKIHMFSNLIKDKYAAHVDKSGVSYLDRIIQSSARMTMLVNDLLSFSRLSVNHLFRPTELNHLLADILGDLELTIQEKNARVDIGDLPMIDAVPGQMRQVFQNLLSNALKFSHGNVQPVITITSELIAGKSFDSPASEKGSCCRITVSDNGIGFDEQYRDKIFTIFQRLHSREKYEGTGIGLAITKKIIDKHNGLITARSVENEGSDFIIILPLKQDEEATGSVK